MQGIGWFDEYENYLNHMVWSLVTQPYPLEMTYIYNKFEAVNMF